MAQAFCKRHKLPLAKACRRCGREHPVESYSRFVDDDGDEWLHVDYGRCDAMTEPNQCLRLLAPLSEDMRDFLRGGGKDDPS